MMVFCALAHKPGGEELPAATVDSSVSCACTTWFGDRRPSAVVARLWRGRRILKEVIVAKKVAKKSPKAAGKRTGAPKAKKAKA